MYTTKDLDAFFAAPMQPVQPRKTLLPAARTQMDQGNTGLGDPMQQPEEEMGVGGYALDVLSSVPKGIVNSARDVAELANLPLQAAGLTEEIPEYFGLFEPPKTAAGAVVDTMVGFFTGYGAVAKGLGVAGRIGGIGMKASKYARAAEIAAMQSMGTKAAKAVNIGKNFAKTAATSAITSGLVFDGNEERLSNLLREYGGFTDPVTEYLAADENDTEIEGRFKNVIEDFLTGGTVELATQLVKPFVRSTVNSVRIHRAGVKAKLAGRNPDEAITREAFRLSEEQAETLARSMNVTMDEAKGILRMIDATGAARENFAFMTRTEAKEYLERLGQRSDEIEAEARGFATINEAGKVIIGGLKGADFDTAIHEVAHGIRMMVVDPAVANKVLRSEDIDILANFAGAVKKTDGSYQWTREAEEKFVASYERYLYEGVFPDRSTRRVFNQLTGWARNIYAQENVSAAALSPDVRNAFDNLVNNGVETTLGKGNGIAGDVLLQSRRPNQFYSALSQSIEGLTTKAFSPSSLNQQFKSLVNSGAVKQAEIDWSGVKEWSAMQEGKVTKESVLDFLQNNGVRVETRELGLFTPEVTQFDEAYKKAKSELESVIKETFPQGDQGRDLLTAEAMDVENLIGNGDYRAGIERRQIDAINRILNEPGARERFAAANDLDQIVFDEDGPVPVGGPHLSSEEALSVLDDYIREFTDSGDASMAARFIAIRDMSPRNLSSESAVSEEAFDKYLDALYTAEEAKKALLKAKKVNGPKWSVYQLEGEKSDYREVLLTLPVKPSPSGAGRIEQLENGMFLVSYPRLGDSVFPTRVEAESDLASKQGSTYSSTHWDDRNVLVHLRMNDRVDADGKRVLFIEEFQSDWAQAGREIGFKPTSERRAAIEQEYRDAELAFKSATPETEAAAGERFDAAMDVYNKEINDASIVRAPFVEKTSGWVDLGLKQVLLEAIRGGYDRVAFINGDQSVARFKKDLTEKVDSVSIVRNENGTYDFKAIKEGNQTYSESGIKGEQLSRVMGKYASAQMIDLADSNPGKVMELASDEIEVGGKGMREFYDSILPLAMDKLLKKYGGSKTGKLELVKDFDRIRADAERMGMGFEDALDLIDESDFPVEYSASQVSFDVTPGLKDGVSPGLPLFQARRSPNQQLESSDPLIRGEGQAEQAQAAVSGWTRRWLQSDVTIRRDDPRWETARSFGQGKPKYEGEVTQANLAEVLPQGRTLFHETNLNGVKALISRIVQGPRNHAPFFVSDNIDLALGQQGRGYIIELDPQFTNGQKVDAAERKPGLAMTEQVGAGTELRVDKTLRQSLRSVIVPNQRGLEALRRVPGLSALLDFENPIQAERGLRIDRKTATSPNTTSPNIMLQARRSLTEGKTPGRLQPPEGELNYGRASTIAQLNESIEANYEEKLKAIRSQPETLEMSLASAEVARRSVANALNLDNFNSFEAFDAKTPGSSAAIQESRRAIIAHRQILADVGLLVFNRARAYQTANPEEMYEFLRGEQIMRYTSYKVKGMVAEIARGLSGQRMVLEPNPDFRLLPDVSQVFETGFPQTPQLGGLGYPDEAAILEGVAGRPPASARGGMEARQGESVQVAPDLEFRDSRKSIVEATVEQAGGADAVRRRMKEYALQGASGDPLSVVKYASGARYGSAMLEYFMNSILSSPVTQTVNALGNTLTSYYIPLERALGATIRGDMVTAAQQLSHVRHLNHSWGYAVKMMGAAFKANRNVLDNVGTVEVRGNAISSDLLVPVAQRFGYGKETLQNMGLAWAADKIGVLINTPTRTLMAADEMFKQLNYRAALMTELEIEGLKRFEGDSVAAAQWAGDTIDQMLVNGQRYAETAVLERANQLADAAVAGGRIAPENRVRFVAAYMSNGDNWDPSLGVLSDRALDLSRYATFSTPLSTVNDTKLGRFSAHIQRAVDVHPVFRFIVPFVRTPTRILEFAIDRTPPGAAFNLRTAFKKTSSELTTADATVKAEAVGRLAFSVMTLATFGMYASSGMITGAGPENKAERDAWLAAGNQPYSIRMGDNWVSYRRLDPFASMVGMIVDFFNAAEDGHSKGNPALENVSHALVIGLSNNLTNKSYLTGLTNLVNAINDPNRYGQDFVNQYVSALVPFSSALRQSKDTAGDLVVRDIRTMFDAIKNTVPGAAAGVSPRRNILGEPVTKASSGMAGIDLFNPFSYTKVSDDLIFNEMNNIGHAFAAPREVKAGMTLPEIVGASGQNAYDRWQELHGTVLVGGKTLRQALTKLIRSRDYQRMSPESNDVYDSPRVRAMRMVVDRYRNAAFKQLMKEFPEVAQGVKNDFAVKKAMRTGRPVQELMDLVNR